LKNSPERINFITDYLSAYEAKIKLLNKNGLFDSAKLLFRDFILIGGFDIGEGES
jgi:hypothetical protein